MTMESRSRCSAEPEETALLTLWRAWSRLADDREKLLDERSEVEVFEPSLRAFGRDCSTPEEIDQAAKAPGIYVVKGMTRGDETEAHKRRHVAELKDELARRWSKYYEDRERLGIDRLERSIEALDREIAECLGKIRTTPAQGVADLVALLDVALEYDLEPPDKSELATRPHAAALFRHAAQLVPGVKLGSLDRLRVLDAVMAPPGAGDQTSAGGGD